jgi:hypothetical protein
MSENNRRKQGGQTDIGRCASDKNYLIRLLDVTGGCIPKKCPGNGFLGKNCECYCPGANMYDIILCDEKG